MNNIKKNVLEAIGNTPIVKLNKVADSVESEIYAKLEYINPGGSIKDRIGYYILQKAIESGELKPGGTIVEGTSGNTGVGLAMFAAVHGYKSIFVLADKQSPEKIANLRAFGAKVIVCPTNVHADDPRSYYSVSKRLAESVPNSYYVNQYDNLLNREAHFNTTGPEIYEQTKGEFDVLLCGIGTGGTISGIAAYLKPKMPHLKVVALDPEGSILAEYHKTKKIGEAKPYVLEGIGEDIIPLNINFDLIDDFVVINDKESFLMTRSLLINEGIYAGGSSGAAVVAAIKYAKKLKTKKRILVILPDSGNRYSSKIYNDDWMRENNYVSSNFNVLIKEALSSIGKEKSKVMMVDDSTNLKRAVSLMEEHGISQLPVTAKGKVVGVLSENEIMRPIFEGKLNLNDSVSVAYHNRYQIFSSSDLLDKVIDSLMKKNIVLITEGDQISHILTSSDILQFISTQGKF